MRGVSGRPNAKPVFAKMNASKGHINTRTWDKDSSRILSSEDVAPWM